jgi:hypothetical protein
MFENRIKALLSFILFKTINGIKNKKTLTKLLRDCD